MTTDDAAVVTEVELTQELHDEREGLDDNYVVVLVAKGGARLPPTKASRSPASTRMRVRQPLGWQPGFKKSDWPTGYRRI
jgi:hypothetical protein